MNGSIECESKEGAGTTFIVRISQKISNDVNEYNNSLNQKEVHK